jgi:hypothetical protein
MGELESDAVRLDFEPDAPVPDKKTTGNLRQAGGYVIRFCFPDTRHCGCIPQSLRWRMPVKYLNH